MYIDNVSVTKLICVSSKIRRYGQTSRDVNIYFSRFVGVSDDDGDMDEVHRVGYERQRPISDAPPRTIDIAIDEAKSLHDKLNGGYGMTYSSEDGLIIMSSVDKYFQPFWFDSANGPKDYAISLPLSSHDD